MKMEHKIEKKRQNLDVVVTCVFCVIFQPKLQIVSTNESLKKKRKEKKKKKLQVPHRTG